MKLRSSARHGAPVLLALAAALLAPEHARAAVESAASAPDPLQYPTVAAPGAREFSTDLLRPLFEAQANGRLCELLLKDANRPIPEAFDFSKCPEPFASKVRNKQGKVHWAGGAKPSECGSACFRRPSNGREQNRTVPNTNHASFTGHFEFELEITGPNRNVRFPYETFFRCVIPPGQKSGDVAVKVVFGQPVIGDPSFFEGVLNFFTGPLDWSRRVEDGIRAELSRPGSVLGPGLGACTSIGANAPANADPKFDAILFDAPRTGGGGLKGGAVARITRSANLRFTQIVRKPPVFRVAPPADPGTFTAYVNGVPVPLPISTALPAAGGAAPINLCKRVDMEGFDRLQVIFATSLGGAAWSQFVGSDGFGEGPQRTLLTGRTVVVPALNGGPGAKPEPIFVREFELAYTIDYTAPPTMVSAGTTAPPSVGPAAPGAAITPGKNTRLLGRLDQLPTATPTPCTQL